MNLYGKLRSSIWKVDILNTAIKVTWPRHHRPTPPAQVATNDPNGGLSNLHSSYLLCAIDHIEPSDSLWSACVFLLLCLKTQIVTGSVWGRGAAQCVGGMTDMLPNTPPGFHWCFFFNPDLRDTCECNLESVRSMWEISLRSGAIYLFFSLFIDAKLVKRTAQRPLYSGSI